VIARDDVPVARLVPMQETPERELGFIPFTVPDSFFEPIDEAELNAWE
jgi:antitoxin (DNA-binding transcriptional repressor) of toxin-antitoxin stability system